MYNVNIRVANSEINTQSERVLHERVYHPIKRKIGKADRTCIVVTGWFGNFQQRPTRLIQLLSKHRGTRLYHVRFSLSSSFSFTFSLCGLHVISNRQ